MAKSNLVINKTDFLKRVFLAFTIIMLFITSCSIGNSPKEHPVVSTATIIDKERNFYFFTPTPISLLNNPTPTIVATITPTSQISDVFNEPTPEIINGFYDYFLVTGENDNNCLTSIEKINSFLKEVEINNNQSDNIERSEYIEVFLIEVDNIEKYCENLGTTKPLPAFIISPNNKYLSANLQFHYFVKYMREGILKKEADIIEIAGKYFIEGSRLYFDAFFEMMGAE